MRKIVLIVLLCIVNLAAFAGKEITLTLVDREVVYEYTSATGDWYFGAYDETGLYTVHLDYLTSKYNKYGTFTDADLDHVYSYIRHTIGVNNEELQITKGSKFTFANEGNTYTLTGRLLCSDGNTYVINGRFKQPDPKTFDVEGQFITYLEYLEEDGDWDIRFKNDDYKITLDLLSADGHFSGTYTERDAAYEGACFITDRNEDEDIPFDSFNVTLLQSDEVLDPRKGCEITGTGISKNGDIYHFHMIKYPPIRPKSQVTLDVQLTKGEWPYSEQSNDYSYYELTEKDNDDEKWIIAPYRLIGEVSEEEIDTAVTVRFNTNTGKKIKLDNGKITQTLDDETMSINVQAQLVMSDSVQYNFSFCHPLNIGEHLSYSYTNLWIDDSYAQYGCTLLNASNDSSSIDVNLLNTKVPGSYDSSNVQANLCIHNSDGNENYINSLAIIHAESTIDEDGSPFFYCSFIGSDMNVHTVYASFIMPEVTDTLCIQLTNAMLYDGTETNDGFNLYYHSDDYSSACYIGVKSGNKISGHYSVDQLETSSYLYITDDNGQQQSWRFYKGTFNVNNTNGTVTLTGTFQAGNHYVNLTITTADWLTDGIARIETDGNSNGSSKNNSNNNGSSKDNGRSNGIRFNTIGQHVDTRYKGIIIENRKKRVQL